MAKSMRIYKTPRMAPHLGIGPIRREDQERMTKGEKLLRPSYRGQPSWKPKRCKLQTPEVTPLVFENTLGSFNLPATRGLFTNVRRKMHEEGLIAN